MILFVFGLRRLSKQEGPQKGWRLEVFGICQTDDIERRKSDASREESLCLPLTFHCDDCSAPDPECPHIYMYKVVLFEHKASLLLCNCHIAQEGPVATWPA